MAKLLELENYIRGILAGDRAILARAITIIESDAPKYQELAQNILSSIYNKIGKAKRIAVTGSPGAGKSTFIEAFATHLCDIYQYNVAVLAIDPSSAISGGSILGDKTRMEELSRNPRAFIRPSPSAGALGGVTRKTKEVMMLCEAAGFDIVIIETVGVGQGEFLVRDMVDFFLMVAIPGAGDELQGIKRGIMELVDGVVVNKNDGERKQLVDKTKGEISSAVHYLSPITPDWTVFVEKISSLENTGIDSLTKKIIKFFDIIKNNGHLDRLRDKQALEWIEEFFKQTVLDIAYKKYKKQLDDAKTNILKKKTNELVESRNLLKELNNNE